MQFQSRIADLQTRRLIYNNLGKSPDNKGMAEHIKRELYNDYLLGKAARVFYMPVAVPISTGQTSPKTGFSVPVSHNLIITGVTHNAPTGVTLTMFNDTARQQQFSNVNVPPTALASDTSNNIYRYMPLPVPFFLEENSQIQCIAQAPGGAVNQTVTFVFQCIWTADQFSNSADDERLDKAIWASLDDPTLMQPYATAMTVPFTGTALERVTASTKQDSEPLLVLGIQQSLQAKETSTTNGPTMVLRDSSINYTFSQGVENAPNSQTFVWAYGNFTNEPEQYILFPFPYLLRPNAQLVGEFTNGSTGFEATEGQVIFLCRRVRMSLADLYTGA